MLHTILVLGPSQHVAVEAGTFVAAYPAAAAAAADGVELEPGTPAAAEEPFVAGAAAGGDGPRSAALAATC